jgi:hypothetical protein
MKQLSFFQKIDDSLRKIENTLSETRTSLSKKTFKSITGRDWILSIFYFGIIITSGINDQKHYSIETE